MSKSILSIHLSLVTISLLLFAFNLFKTIGGRSPSEVSDLLFFYAFSSETSLFYGMAIALIIVAALQFFQTGQQSQLYLVGFVLMMTCALFLLAGWPDLNNEGVIVSKWSGRFGFFCSGLCGLFAVFLADRFLDRRRRFPELEFAFQTAVGLNLTFAAVSLLSFTVASYMVPFVAFLTLSGVLSLSLISWNRKMKFARYFTIGLESGVTGLILICAPNTGYIGAERTDFIGILLMLAGIFMIAFALADKTNMLHEERQELDRKAMERQRLAVESLKRANERKDEMIAATSHGLRAPLYGMVSIAESLQEVTAGRMPQEINYQLGSIASSGKQLAAMVSELLDTSKIKLNIMDMNNGPVNLSETVGKAIAVCQPFASKSKIRIVNKIPAELPPVKADSERFQQVLHQLIGSAVGFAESDEVTITAELRGKRAVLFVMPADGQASRSGRNAAGDPAYRQLMGDSEEFGLLLTKRLVELQGGKLDVATENANGPMFQVAFPLYIEEPVNLDYDELDGPAGLPAVHFPLWGKGSKVVVAVDETITRQQFAEELGRIGCEVIEMTEGDDLLKVLQEQSVDLVVLETELADLDGLTLCREIRKTFSPLMLPVLMLTTKEHQVAKMSAFHVGANDCLEERCSLEEFTLRVQSLIRMRKIAQEMESITEGLKQDIKERSLALEIANMNLLTVNEEMLEMEKSRNDMLSAISHELGTPITLIHTYIQAVKANLIEENNPRYLDMIQNKLLLLERLTEDLSELSKYRGGSMQVRFEKVGVKKWLGRLLKELESDVTQSGRQFAYEEVDEGHGEFLLLVDTARLDQVFSNIVWNAVKHTEASRGKIRIVAEIHSGDRNGAFLASAEADGELVIKIEDNGVGIDRKALPHIFERFYKADKTSKYKGSGLGLAIAKEIVTSHQGQIWAESTLGEGSCFFVSLPLKM